RRLDDAPFDLSDDAVRIDHEPGVDRAPYLVQADLLVDRKLNDHSGIGGAVLVSREGEAAPATLASGCASLPFGHGSSLLDNGPCAGILGDRKPVLHRILPRPCAHALHPPFHPQNIRPRSTPP